MNIFIQARKVPLVADRTVFTSFHEDFDVFGEKVCSLVGDLHSAWQVIAWSPRYDLGVRFSEFSPSYNWVGGYYMLYASEEAFASMGPDLGRFFYRHEEWMQRARGVDPGRKAFQKKFEALWGPL